MEKSRRKPDYTVWAIDKDTESKGNVGAAWLDESNGHIFIKLDNFVVLQAKPNLSIYLYPKETEDAVT